MSNEKKVELNEENLEEVAGGLNAKQVIAGAAAVAAGVVTGYATYNKTMSTLDGKDQKGGAGGNGSGGSGSGISNNNSSSTQKVGQQGNYNANSGSIRM